MVRYAKKEDLERVNELRKQVSDLHAKGRPDQCRAEFGKELQDEVYHLWEKDDSDVIIAIRENIICGFACVEYIDKTMSAYTLPRHYYHIREFGVDEPFRRQKVATELFDYIKKEANHKGYPTLELDVFTFNESAIKFYESVGFAPYRIYMEHKLS